MMYSRKLYISTNSTCNLECVYCFENAKKPFAFDVEGAVEVILKQLQTTTEHGTQISLRGGEPFLLFDKIKELCERVWSENISEYYHFHITTNGTLIHGNIKKWLYEHRSQISIKLNLDGDKISSDINRPNSFDRIDLPFFANTWSDLKVNMTVTSQTLPFLFRNVVFIHSVGAKHILTHFSIMTDWEKCHLEKVLYEQLRLLSQYYLQKPTIEPCSLFNKDISLTLSEPCRLPCNCNQIRAYDFQTKKYYPCYMCFPSIGGEKVSKVFAQIDFTADSMEDECCLHCPFINLCITCYAENYITRGALSHRDMALCPYQKVTFAALFEFEYNRIIRQKDVTDEDINNMKAIQKWYPEIRKIVLALV